MIGQVGGQRHATAWVAIAAWGLLLAGIALSAWGSIRWHEYVASGVEQAFVADAERIRSAVSAELMSDRELLVSLQGLIAADPGLTNEQFLVWSESTGLADRSPGDIGFGFVERVPAADLAAFAADRATDPVNGLVSEPTFVVFPDRQADEYCLQRVGIWTGVDIRGFVIPPGLDFCAADVPGVGPSAVPTLLSMATDTAELVVVPPELFVSGSFALFSPVYSQVPTASVEARRAASLGWVAGSFDSRTLLTDALKGTSGLSVTVFAQSGDETHRIVGGGNAPADATATLMLPLRGTPGWTVRVVGTPTVPGASPLAQAVGLLLIGVTLATMLFLMIRLLGDSRSRALALVDRKTSELEYLARHDALTNLPNRSLLLEHADLILRRCREIGTPMTVLFLDIDGFKSINDTLGHAAGDDLLNAVAGRAAAVVRGPDVIGRLGGDEFVVLAVAEESGSTPESIAERIMEAIAEPFSIDGAEGVIHVTASVGTSTGLAEDPEVLLHQADMAMYEAKARGRNQVVVYETFMGNGRGARA